MRTCVLSVAGYDPSGGAGVLADIKTFEQLSCTGIAVLTATTVQHPEKFESAQWRPVDQIKQELRVLSDYYTPVAVKLGIIESLEVLATVVAYVKRLWVDVMVVWDPVLKPTAGGTLGFNDSARMSDLQLKGIDVVTPNNEEYLQLFEGHRYATSVVRTGLKKDGRIIDVVYRNGQEHELVYEMSDNEVHGSGCVFSSALTVHLAKGIELPEAVQKAHDYVAHYFSSSNTLVGYHT